MDFIANGMTKRQRRGRQDTFHVITHFWQAGCIPSAQEPLSAGAGVGQTGNMTTIFDLKHGWNPTRLFLDIHFESNVIFQTVIYI